MSGRTQVLFLSAALVITAFACVAFNEIFIPLKQDSSAALLPGEVPSEPITPSPGAACSAALTEILQAATLGVPEKNISDLGVDREGSLVTYKVLGDEISEPYYEAVPADLQAEQDAMATHKAIWDYFRSLIPLDEREIVAEFSVMTDGKGGILAGVAQTSTNPERWVLKVDIVDAEKRANLTYTLVHELGHLLTLGPYQVQPSLAIFETPDDTKVYEKEAAACPSYFPGEGCSRSDSYINVFYNYFWGGIYEEWQDIDLLEGDDAYYQGLDKFYLEFKDQFVTNYAVISPEEDIAESWAFFVLGPKPGGATKAEQKILFFYDFPELVQTRDEILNNLCAVYP